MIRKLVKLLRLTARDLEEWSESQPADSDQTESKEQPATDIQDETPTPDEAISPPADIPPSPSLWRRFFNAERERVNWLRSHPYVIGIALGLAIIVIVAEQWLIQSWSWLLSQATLLWRDVAAHPLALIAVGVAIFYLIFGLQWLRSVDDLTRSVLGSARRHPRLSALVGGILVLIGLWAINSYGTWVVLPFTVGHTEAMPLEGETVAGQLIAELNQVGVGNPTPVLILWELREPRTSSGRVTARRNLPLEECEVILRGPGDFTASRRIPLPRVLTGSQGSRLDLGNLSIGTISIPSQIFTQFLLRLLPTGYREFSGQINANRSELEISVSSRNPPRAWRVAGPSDAFPEMIEYLALRMALDLNPDLIKSSGLDAAPSDRDLAFAMGNQAFRQQRYQRAQAFYQLADHFAPLDEKVDAMLGLTYYHLALRQDENDSTRFEPALQAMEAAVQEDPNGDSSVLRPYLACLYHEADMPEAAEAHRIIFAQYLRRLEFQDFEVRVDALKQLPLHGPGRHLAANNEDVIFVDETGTIRGAQGQPLDANLSITDQNPRQIALYGDSSLLLVSSDGAVLATDYQAAEETPQPTVLIEGRALDGVQQMATSASQFRRTNLFLLNREGEIYWCEPDAQTGIMNACPPRNPIGLPTARQIFPVEDQLYILATDGAVWRTEINLIGSTSSVQSLTPAAPVQEIFVGSNGTLFLLHDNGNVWRYYDDHRPETEDLKLIDPGTGTNQIFAADGYLYLLKSNGAIWRIKNPRNPLLNSDLNEIWIPQQDTVIQEMYVKPPAQNQDTSDSRALYLLTSQRVLLQATDTGDSRVTFSPINTTTPAQAALPE